MFSKSLRRRSFQTTLISAWLAAKRLNQTLTRLAEVGTGSLLRRRHGGMAECVALTDGRDPCLITCSASKTPERQLYCDLSAQVIPRLRNLIQLLHAKVSSQIFFCDSRDGLRCGLQSRFILKYPQPLCVVCRVHLIIPPV